jgi:Rrf2 family protein
MGLITTKSRYGLQLLIYLADRYGSGPVELGGAARANGIPEHYLAKLALPLKAAGLIRSIRGQRGGWELARPPADIDMLSVVEALEGRSSLQSCTGEPGRCDQALDCRPLVVWSGMDRVIKDYLGGLSLADAATTVLDYVI